MKALQAFIDKENKWASLFKGQTIFEIQTADGRKHVAQRIDAALSPENLSCDGELSRTEVNARYRSLQAAAKDLIKLDPSAQQYMYEYE